LVFGDDLEGHEDQNDYDNCRDHESRWHKHGRLLQPGLFMNFYYVGRCSRPAGLVSFGLLDVLLRVRLRRPHLREAPADFGLSRLATPFLDYPGYRRAPALHNIYS